MDDLIRHLPKAELHIHIEGTLEPELMFTLAERNRYELPFADVEAVRAAYQFTDLQSFLDIYYQGAAVLQTPQDFYELTTEYFDRVAGQGIKHVEMFFDPQTHTERGVGFDVFMEGFRSAMDDAETRHGITSSLILCFLRHLPGEDALRTIEMAEPHLEGVIAVGLDSSEVGNPPNLFVDAYRRAEELGLKAVAHAGEEGPPAYVWSALDDLGVVRIDHGVRSLEDRALVDRLSLDQIPLTVCPLSNVALRVVDHIGDHPLPRMIESGLLVSINSDDPSYFGGYVGENYTAVAKVFPELDMAELAANSIASSFAAEDRKQELLDEIAALSGMTTEE